MRRKRGGHLLSIWQMGLLAHLFAGGTLHCRFSRRTDVFYWWLVTFDGFKIRVGALTVKSLGRMGLISLHKKRITVAGARVVGEMLDEELQAVKTMFHVHDLRLTRGGKYMHGMERVTDVLHPKEAS